MWLIVGIALSYAILILLAFAYIQWNFGYLEGLRQRLSDLEASACKINADTEAESEDRVEDDDSEEEEEAESDEKYTIWKHRYELNNGPLTECAACGGTKLGPPRFILAGKHCNCTPKMKWHLHQTCLTCRADLPSQPKYMKKVEKSE